MLTSVLEKSKSKTEERPDKPKPRRILNFSSLMKKSDKQENITKDKNETPNTESNNITKKIDNKPKEHTEFTQDNFSEIDLNMVDSFFKNNDDKSESSIEVLNDYDTYLYRKLPKMAE